MNKKLRKALSDAAPQVDRTRKDAFLRSMRRQYPTDKIGTFALLRSQLTYIRLPVWLISLLALFLGILGIGTHTEMVLPLSAVTPFVSGIALFETLRSGMYRMTELEGATLISLRGRFFARLICIGTSHLILLLLLTFLTGRESGYGFAMTGAILTLPYLITSWGSMMLERHARGRKSPFGCLGIAGLVSLLMIILRDEQILFSESYRHFWYVALILLAALTLIEIKKTFRWEEYVWNS